MPMLPKNHRKVALVTVAVAAAIGYSLGQRHVHSPSEPPAVLAAPDLNLPARCRQTADHWKNRLDENCQVLVKSPFVLAGNLSTAKLNRLYEQTIAPAAKALAGDYFANAPSEPVTILCFADESTYFAAARKLFGERKPSPYGFYRPHGRVVITNISTGTGTLVHELTHALVDFDFPKLADWFNEGLASLHEACCYATDDTGRIHLQGLPNWRLPGLKKLITNRTLQPTAKMIAADDFRGPLEGANYAHARYLCLYLQQRRKLTEFYRSYRANHATDPYGLKSLTQVLNVTDWADFDRGFWHWTLALAEGK